MTTIEPRGGSALTGAPPAPTVSKAYQSLRAMAEDFVLFTPALVCVYGQFPRDPVAEFLRTTALPAHEHPVAMDMNNPVFDIGATSAFAGLQSKYVVNWDHRLYAVPHAAWEACRDFIAKIAVFSSGQRFYAEVGYHTIEIRDPASADATVPRGVEIYAFAVSSNRYLVHLAVPRVGEQRPYPLFRPPVKEVVATADQLLQAKGDSLGDRLDRVS